MTVILTCAAARNRRPHDLVPRNSMIFRVGIKGVLGA